ncbi:type I CRISPR-associated protein Cas7 [Porphyromonas gingivicanis]|uniref:type I CRISPR-associated protein Cas7 n=1 Tax=Porphyromonas gingivicanis TaxID=266762 RepID=UPI00046F1CA2|nr:type I CRISPR-associated protein Cas7 [Porphyromonas gingivicanis]
MNTITKKSEILFLYETQYNIPNGDPFTGEQRYDTETKKILVSDVRMKRYVRSYLEDVKGLPIYVSEKTGVGKTDAKGVLNWIVANRNDEGLTDIGEILKKQVDVRLFGGISTLGDDAKKIKVGKETCTNGHVQFTGPVQFALLNPSLNSVDLRMHQNTTHFTSKAGNAQGSIGTTTIVPYSLVQIHGWINPKVAETTALSSEDIKLMYEGLWYGTSGDGSSHSRSKIGQNSVLLLELEYVEANRKIYGVERLISLNPNEGKREEDIRNMDDYTLDFHRLIEVANSDKVSKVKYYTEIDAIKKLLQGPKFEFMEL